MFILHVASFKLEVSCKKWCQTMIIFPSVSCMYDSHAACAISSITCITHTVAFYIGLMFNVKHCTFNFNCYISHVIFLYVDFMFHVYTTHCIFEVMLFHIKNGAKNDYYPTMIFMLHV